MSIHGWMIPKAYKLQQWEINYFSRYLTKVKWNLCFPKKTESFKK